MDYGYIVYVKQEGERVGERLYKQMYNLKIVRNGKKIKQTKMSQRCLLI